MPPRKGKFAPGARLQQQSLFDYAIPTSSSKIAPDSPPKQSFRSDSGPSRASRPTKRKRAQPTQLESGSSDSNVEAIHFEPRPVDAIFVSDTEEDESPISPRPQKHNRAALAPASSRRVVTSDDDMVDDDKPAALAKGKGRATIVLSSEDENVEKAIPKRRRLVRGSRPSTPESEDEVDESGILDSRLRSRGKRTQFQKNLEKLKRKKGAAVLSSSEEEGDEENEDYIDREALPFDGAKRDRVGSDDDSEESQAGEDSFIVPDDVATVTNLPAAFSMAVHQDLSHHFKVICQLFVHMAVRPVQERRAFIEHVLKEEDYFSLPLKMARNKLSGLRDSAASSMWRTKLRNSFRSFPNYLLHSLDDVIPHCDACHMGGRMSTVMGRLDGPFYDQYTFEPIDESDDSSGEKDEDRFQKKYNLGRFCAARTQVFHRLSHWEYHLFHAVLGEIDQLRGSGKFVRVAYYKGLLPPSDLSDADGIMDWLDQRGFVTMEWQKIKEMMSSVRKLDSHTGKEDDFELDIM